MIALQARCRHRGQTIVLLALVLGALMTVAALVIDVGSTHRVRTETQYVCDAASLAGMADILVNHDPDFARARALLICERNGYKVGEQGVTEITARAFHHSAWPEEDPAQIDRTDSDRYQVTIHRELPQYLAAIIGISRTGVKQMAVAALLGSVPGDVELGSRLLFPDFANLAQFGPDAQYSFGDCFGTKFLDNGAPNPLYDSNGYIYDVNVPEDLEASSGSSWVRIELFDPDTINQGNHVHKNPFKIQDVNGNPDEPEKGAIDEIRAGPPNGNINTSPEEFPARSTQTEYILLDGSDQAIATATFGPTSNTPFWYLTSDPQTSPPTTATHGDPAQAQIATDLHWVTPQGFEFDTNVHAGPYKVRVHTLSGSSENGFTMRASTHRADGVSFDPLAHGVTATSALGIYARGRLPINFHDSGITTIPIASVPSGAKEVKITNFDTDVGALNMKLTMKSFDSTTGQGEYPVLFPAPPDANPSEIIEDANGNQYVLELDGNLSGNAEFAASSLDVPQPVNVPQTDGNGELIFDGDGKIIIVDQREFEGGDIYISYSAGANDTSVWETSSVGPPDGGSQRIVLIR